MNTSPSSTLTQRLQSIKEGFSGSTCHRRRRGGGPSQSSSTSPSLHVQSNHGQQMKSFKRHRQKLFYSTEHYKTLERAKRCTVTLESNYRHNLELNTTYLIGKTTEGQMFLLPKQLVEQANTAMSTDGSAVHESFPAIDYSDVSEDEESECKTPSRKSGTFQTAKSAYSSQGNIVTCVTGSFN